MKTNIISRINLNIVVMTITFMLLPCCSIVAQDNDEVKFQNALADAQAGDTEAMLKVGAYYLLGQGVTQSDTQAVEWFSKGAEMGVAGAQTMLGACYEAGRGVIQNYAKAVEWYMKAAEQGDAEAQYNLGVCYDNGDGVAKNLTMAKKWYSKAAAQGSTLAKQRLQELQ